MFRQQFWGTLALSIPTLVWAPMLQRWFHYTAPAFPGARLIPALFGTAVYFYGGWVFIRGAKGELEARLRRIEAALDGILKRLEGNGVLQQLQRGVYTPGPVISGIPRR